MKTHVDQAAAAHWQAQARPNVPYCEVLRQHAVNRSLRDGPVQPSQPSFQPNLMLFQLEQVRQWVVNGHCQIHWQVYEPVTGGQPERLVVVFVDASKVSGWSEPAQAHSLLMYAKAGHYER